MTKDNFPVDKHKENQTIEQKNVPKVKNKTVKTYNK